MFKTVIEYLEENIQADGTYEEGYVLEDHELEGILDVDDFILGPNTQAEIALEDVFAFLESEEAQALGDDPDAFYRALTGLDENFYINSLSTLLFALQAQYEETGHFKRTNLYELGTYTLGSYDYLLNAYDILVNSHHFKNAFLLDLGQTLLETANVEHEFKAGLHILANFEYEEVKERIPELDDIIQLSKYYPWWQQELISALYLWKQDEPIYDIFKQEKEAGEYHKRLVFFQTFHPLREEMGLYLANNTQLVEYDLLFSRYIQADKFLLNHYSENLLEHVLGFVNTNYREDLLDIEEENKVKLDQALIHTLLTQDIPKHLHSEIHKYYTILKNEENPLHKELEGFF